MFVTFFKSGQQAKVFDGLAINQNISTLEQGLSVLAYFCWTQEELAYKRLSNFGMYVDTYVSIWLMMIYTFIVTLINKEHN